MVCVTLKQECTLKIEMKRTPQNQVTKLLIILKEKDIKNLASDSKFYLFIQGLTGLK